MSERLPSQANPFSAKVVGAMIGIGIAAFIAIFALIGWSPDLASRDRAGEHPYSTSALGYAGLVRLLEADGRTVSISRLPSSLDSADGLLVITIPVYGYHRATEFDLTEVSQPALYVLPKWTGYPDREKPSWQKDTSLMTRQSVARLVREFDSDADVWRLRNPAGISTPFGPQKPTFEHQMQVIDSDSLEAVIKVPGGTILAKLPGQDVFILSDPDILNTFGLARRDNALFALNLFDWLSTYEGMPVVFDATLHGFERSESLLKAIFDVPFLGATLLAIATILMIGWAGFVRFAPPFTTARPIAFGKLALADSSAGLVAMSRREGRMAPGYLTLTKRALQRRLGLPDSLDDADLSRTLNALARRKQLPEDWAEKSSALARDAHNRDDLRDKAHALWRWRKEMTDGH